MDKGRTSRATGFWVICLLILILDSKTVIASAAQGIDLCVRVLIPSIFPFLVISSLVAANAGHCAIIRPLVRPLRLPEGAEDLFFLGLLSGYPVGASMVSQAARSNRIAKRDADRLLAFCSNAGPSFIFGIGATLFPRIGYCLAQWLIQIMSAALVGIITPGKQTTAKEKRGQRLSVPRALQNALPSMASICGWVVLFRILITVLDRWALWILPPEGEILARGILELANGMVSMSEIGNIGQRMIYTSMLLSFGGICVWMQTLSVADGLSTRYYLPGKLAQSAISFLLATAAQFLFPAHQRYIPHPLLLALCAGIVISYWYFLRKSEISSRNSNLLGV